MFNNLYLSKFLIKTALFIVGIQFLSLLVMSDTPSYESISSLLTFFIAITLLPTIHIFIFQKQNKKIKIDNNIIYKIDNKIIYILLICDIIIFPDAVSSLSLLTSTLNGRETLLEATHFIVNYKLLNFVSSLISIIFMYFILVSKKTYIPKKVWLFLSLSVILSMMIYGSRSQIIFLTFFYLIINWFSIFNSLKKVFLLLGIPIILILFTVYIQNRATSSGVDILLFYMGYFAYPLFLFDKINIVFNDIDTLWVFFGYPYDILFDYKYQDLIKTYSIVGYGLNGKFHGFGNVLYPHHGLLTLKYNLLVTFFYYFNLTATIMLLYSKYKFFRISIIIFAYVLYQGLVRSPSIGVSSFWLTLIGIFLLIYFFKPKKERLN